MIMWLVLSEGCSLFMTSVWIDYITIFFDRNSLDLKGWEIKDQYNNYINFSLKIIARNDVFEKGTFKLPKIN